MSRSIPSIRASGYVALLRGKLLLDEFPRPEPQSGSICIPTQSMGTIANF